MYKLRNFFMKFLMWYGIFIAGATILGAIVVGIWQAIDPKILDAPFMNSTIPDNLSPYLFEYPIGIPLLGLIIIFIIGAIQNAIIKSRLRKVGQKTTGTYTSIKDTGVTVNLSPMVHVKVKTKQGEGEFDMFVSRVGFPRVGESIEVVYNPGNPSEMRPSWVILKG